MNERIKELAEQAGITFDSLGASYTFGSLPDFLERFAGLVRQDEREVCVKLCLEPIYYGQVQNNRSTVGGNKYVRDKTVQECAAAIHARGEK